MGELINLPKKDNKVEEVNKELDSRFLKDEEGEIMLDEHGNPLFKDRLAMKITTKDLHFMWNCLKDLLEFNTAEYNRTLKEREDEAKSKGVKVKAYGAHVIPPDEVNNIFDLMEMMGAQEKHTDKQYMLELPSNYFFGCWRAYREILALGVYGNQVGKKKWLEEIATGMANILDGYHEVLRQEKIEDNVKVEQLTNPNNRLRIAEDKKED